MGGPGSGSHYHWWRDGKKTTVGACRSLDACHWSREGSLKPGVLQTGGWAWYTGEAPAKETASIGYEICTLNDRPPWVRLFYTVTSTNERIDYRVLLTTTRPRFGGLRWWFLCPLSLNGRACGRRVRKLYLPPGSHYFGCRHCFNLTYTSTQESHRFDRVYRVLAGNIGMDFHLVKQAMDRIGKDKR